MTTRFAGTFAEIGRCVHRMQGDEVDGTLASPFREIARTFPNTFADICGAVAYV